MATYEHVKDWYLARPDDSVFGANASGMSNLLSEWLRRGVARSSRRQSNHPWGHTQSNRINACRWLFQDALRKPVLLPIGSEQRGCGAESGQN
ncbi:hypothetical protein GCM10017557_23950 [Streptomyces aurantiacus]|uniref:Uncharacterized protein n=1 Tax=Streptomyces aurantiacus TaxID=47760 RepID=A0A7G1P182_9ACTN|nr:hypothetical protein GCM10017557_23950 [Streptomyces aurantiacus]